MGRTQARNTGWLLAADPWNVVVSSPLLRAVQAAHLIADAVGLQPVDTVPELVERDYGSAEGMHLNGLTLSELTGQRYPRGLRCEQDRRVWRSQ